MVNEFADLCCLMYGEEPEEKEGPKKQLTKKTTGATNIRYVRPDSFKKLIGEL